MAVSNAAKWNEARSAILAALDIVAEYERLGLKTRGKPTPKGWLAIDGDRSAGINVSDGPFRGRYKDFGGSHQTHSFFSYALKHGKFGGDWSAVMKHYGKQAGVKLPDSDDDPLVGRLDLYELTPGIFYHFAKGKPGVTAEAMQRFGAVGARWPKRASPEHQNHLIAYPCYGSGLLDFDPTGYHTTSANPAQQIRKWQGKDADAQLVKTLQFDEYGLMNVNGIRRLPDAEIVVFFEGISDGLCGEGHCPQDDTTFSVLTCGGSSYYLKPEWLHLFLGKEVWICFDVGDGDDAGQVGAGVNLARLVAAGIPVRNIKLPEPSGGGKMDFRAWMNSGKTWADFVEYAKTFALATPEDAEAQLTPEQALLLKLGITVVGEHQNSQKIEVFSEFGRKAQTIYDIDKLSYSKLIQLAGAPKVHEHVYDGKEPPPGVKTIKDVKNAIAGEAATKRFVATDQIGCGVWSIDGKVVLVGRENYSIVSSAHGVPKLTQQHSPFYCGRLLDVAGSDTAPWFDHGNMSRLMLEAQSDDWCRATFDEAARLFSKWYWRYPPTPRVLAALVGCSFLQSFWEWRPGVAITGGSDSGKSKLNSVLAEGIFGRMALSINKPTEASIRQHMRHHSRVLLLDEFENDVNRPAVLRLLRVASSGGEVRKGTSDQKGVIYPMRHLVWLSAIELGLKEQADLNRYIICDLKEIPAEKRGDISLPTNGQLYDLGQRLIAATIRHHKVILAMQTVLKKQRFDGVPGRLVEIFALPCAWISAVHGHDEATAIGHMGNILAAWDFEGQRVKDEIRLLEDIMTAEVQLDHGKRKSVSQLLSDVGEPDATAALERYGLRRVVKRSEKVLDGPPPPERLFISQEVVKARLLAKSTFAQQQIEQYLLRLPGAIRDKQRLGGTHTVSGVSIPTAEIDKLMVGLDGEDDHVESEFEFD